MLWSAWGSFLESGYFDVFEDLALFPEMTEVLFLSLTVIGFDLFEGDMLATADLSIDLSGLFDFELF